MVSVAGAVAQPASTGPGNLILANDAGPDALYGGRKPATAIKPIEHRQSDSHLSNSCVRTFMTLIVVNPAEE